MRKNPIPGGKIVGTARVAGIYVHETYLEYNGAKANVINFGRGVAPVLKLENILFNTVLLGIVPTKIVPQAILDAVSPEYLTPVGTIVAAYDELLSDANQQTSEAVECSTDKQFFVPKRNTAMVVSKESMHGMGPTVK